MEKICIFAGTLDGRKLSEHLAETGLDITACSATEYGGELLESSHILNVRTGRMDEEEMKAFFTEEGFDLIIDATHPYAEIVTRNIREAAKASDIEYLRLIRANSEAPEDAVFFNDTEEAVEYLKGTEGQILLTTGSKELKLYSEILGFSERVWARILPLESSLKQAEEAGLPASRIIAMQGPFSKEMNRAMIHMSGAAYLVSKMSGRIGGFDEKMEAAREAGITSVVIGRPPEEDGLSMEEMLCEIHRRYGLDKPEEKVMIEEKRPDDRKQVNVTIAGIGMGSRGSMTGDVVRAIEKCDCMIGATRMIEAAREIADHPYVKAIAPLDIVDAIKEHGEYMSFCVLMSGDTGFFSGTKKLLPMLKDEGYDVTVLPGLSSMSYLASRSGESYDGCRMVSLHGRSRNISADVRENEKVLCLVGGEDGTKELISTLNANGLGHVRVIVGERLGYTDEKITDGIASDLKDNSFDSLSAVMIINEKAKKRLNFGFSDRDFLRGGDSEGVVPMTKSEVRACVMSKLQLGSDSVCWDIGAGTGSVSIEMALNAPYGEVYAVEKKEKALELLRENIVKFSAGNINVVPGTAPDALKDLPAPTHVFIGGSSGNMKEILDLILEKNPNARIIASAVSLETVGELAGLIKEYDFTDREVVSLSVARSREIGNYNLMMGQNPIYIFTMQAGGLE